PRLKIASSTAQPPNPMEQLLVARVRVDRGCERADVPRESLRQEQVPRSPVDFRHGRVTQAMKGVQPVESSLHLPGPEGELDAARRDAGPALRAEERILGTCPLAPRGL